MHGFAVRPKDHAQKAVSLFQIPTELSGGLQKPICYRYRRLAKMWGELVGRVCPQQVAGRVEVRQPQEGVLVFGLKHEQVNKLNAGDCFSYQSHSGLICRYAPLPHDFCIS
jgi:hypothetical protein